MTVNLTIPWEHLASSNQRNTRRGGRGHGWGYKRALEAIELHAMNQHRGERPAFPKGTRVNATLHFYPPDFRRRDVANYLKVILDGIEGVVYADDFQVRSLSFLRKDPDGDNPRVEVTVTRARERAA